MIMASTARNRFLPVKLTPFSWMRFCEFQTSTNYGRPVKFFDPMDAPSIEESDGDLEVLVQYGDRMDTLAHRYYGEQLLWWVIALANDMELPILELNPGDVIIIPDPALVRSKYVR